MFTYNNVVMDVTSQKFVPLVPLQFQDNNVIKKNRQGEENVHRNRTPY